MKKRREKKKEEKIKKKKCPKTTTTTTAKTEPISQKTVYIYIYSEKGDIVKLQCSSKNTIFLDGAASP